MSDAEILDSEVLVCVEIDSPWPEAEIVKSTVQETDSEEWVNLQSRCASTDAVTPFVVVSTANATLRVSGPWMRVIGLSDAIPQEEVAHPIS